MGGLWSEAGKPLSLTVTFLLTQTASEYAPGTSRKGINLLEIATLAPAVRIDTLISVAALLFNMEGAHKVARTLATYVDYLLQDSPRLRRGNTRASSQQQATDAFMCVPLLYIVGDTHE